MKWTWIRDHKRVIKVVVGCGLVIYIGYYVVVTRYTAGVFRASGAEDLCVVVPIRVVPNNSPLVGELNAMLIRCYYPLVFIDYWLTGMRVIDVPHDLFVPPPKSKP